MFKTTFWRFSCTVIGALGCPLRDGDSGLGFYMGAGWCTVLLTPQIELAESSLTRNSSLELIFGVQYMLGARWRIKTECFKIHYRAEVEIKVEILIFYDKVRQSVLRYISNKKNT